MSRAAENSGAAIPKEKSKIVRLLGINLQAARKSKQLTQEGIAEMSEVCVDTIKDYEHCRVNSPSLCAVAKIAEALGVTIDYLVTDHNGMHDETSK